MHGGLDLEALDADTLARPSRADRDRRGRPHERARDSVREALPGHQVGLKRERARRTTRVERPPPDEPTTASQAPAFAGRAYSAWVRRSSPRRFRAGRSPAIFVVDPEALAPAKDPDAFVREHGIEAWLDVLSKIECGVTWLACELLGEVTPEADQTIRRDALRRAGAWLGKLAPRLALEQEDAVRTVAERCGYSQPAVERAFRARYWRQAPRAEVSAERRVVAGLTPEL